MWPEYGRGLQWSAFPKSGFIVAGVHEPLRPGNLGTTALEVQGH
jgi:hypothetical protein